ncbi:uncharacterized protein METZ01_LOCUS212768, partial [marine metagenome]
MSSKIASIIPTISGIFFILKSFFIFDPISNTNSAPSTVSVGILDFLTSE